MAEIEIKDADLGGDGAGAVVGHSVDQTSLSQRESDLETDTCVRTHPVRSTAHTNAEAGARLTIQYK